MKLTGGRDYHLHPSAEGLGIVWTITNDRSTVGAISALLRSDRPESEQSVEHFNAGGFTHDLRAGLALLC